MALPSGPMRPPFFIIGTERSGSNLLRMILTSHSKIAVPHPPHLIRYFLPLQKGYGDLSNTQNFRSLVMDVRALLQTHIYPWDVPIDWERVVTEAQPRDVFGIQYALYGQYATAKGKERWGCKSTFLVAQADTLAQHHPQARFLWLFRDPRDVAASSRKSVFSATHPLSVAQLWKQQQNQALKWEGQLSGVLRIRYEDLIAQPEAEVQRICAHLGEVFEPTMLNYFETTEAKRSGQLSTSWAKTAQPVQKNNKGGYQKLLSPREIQLVESCCAELMQTLDYPLSQPPQPLKIGRIEGLRFALREKVDEVKIELRSIKSDKNVGLRWKRALLLRRLRWTRS